MGAVGDRDCRARGVVPVLVGGSALYTRAILDVFEFPGTDSEVRARYDARLAEVGPEALHAELAERAPGAARDILPTNGRRIVRALEVVELTGVFTATLPESTYADPDTVQIGVDIDRPALDARIARRVEAMWAAGFVEEVRRLDAAGLRAGITASRAIGYRQVLAFLDGEITEDEAREADGRRHPEVRPASGRLVPQGRADHLGWYDDPARLEVAVEAIRRPSPTA